MFNPNTYEGLQRFEPFFTPAKRTENAQPPSMNLREDQNRKPTLEELLRSHHATWARATEPSTDTNYGRHWKQFLQFRKDYDMFEPVVPINPVEVELRFEYMRLTTQNN